MGRPIVKKEQIGVSVLSTAELCEEILGVKLTPYQKVMLNMFDIQLKIERKFFPYSYYMRYFRG